MRPVPHSPSAKVLLTGLVLFPMELHPVYTVTRMAEEKVEEGSIKFKAHIWKVGTLGTGGLRVILNLDQEFIKQMAMLAECQHELIELEFVATARDN